MLPKYFLHVSFVTSMLFSKWFSKISAFWLLTMTESSQSSLSTKFYFQTHIWKDSQKLEKLQKLDKKSLTSWTQRSLNGVTCNMAVGLHQMWNQQNKRQEEQRQIPLALHLEVMPGHLFHIIDAGVGMDLCVGLQFPSVSKILSNKDFQTRVRN